MTATFAHALKTARDRAGFNQCELAERAGFDTSFISRIESGTRRPSAATVLKLADALELVDGSPERDELLLAAGLRPESAMGLLNMASLLPLDAAWLDADDVTRGFLERGVALLLDYAQARKAPARVVRLQTMERRSA